MPNTCNHVNGEFKTIELLFNTNQGVKESKNEVSFFGPFVTLLSHVMIFTTSFRESDMPKMAKISFKGVLD